MAVTKGLGFAVWLLILVTTALDSRFGYRKARNQFMAVTKDLGFAVWLLVLVTTASDSRFGYRKARI